MRVIVGLETKMVLKSIFDLANHKHGNHKLQYNMLNEVQKLKLSKGAT